MSIEPTWVQYNGRGRFAATAPIGRSKNDGGRRLALVGGVFVIFLVVGLLLTYLAATLTGASLVVPVLVLCLVVAGTTRGLFKWAEPAPPFRSREYRSGRIQPANRP